MGKFTFTRAERLSKEKWIKQLFEKGFSLKIYPFRVLYSLHPEPDYPVNQILISVSARNFKRAVDRNLLKRRIREAYRVQKAFLPEDRKFMIGLIYTSKTIERVDQIKTGVLKTLESISRVYSQKTKGEPIGKDPLSSEQS